MGRYVLLLETFGSIVGSLRCRAGFPPPKGNPARRFLSSPLAKQPNRQTRAFALPRSYYKGTRPGLWIPVPVVFRRTPGTTRAAQRGSRSTPPLRALGSAQLSGRRSLVSGRCFWLKLVGLVVLLQPLPVLLGESGVR
jgi:hypothetical protein